jgi:alcohol dehydrogenase, propanol-preferring
MLAIRDATETVSLGHEGVGHIVSMHPSSTDKGFKNGDAVGFLYIRGCCFTCEGCLTHNLLCETGKQLLQGFIVDGFFAEYALVDYHNAVVLDETKWDMTKASAVFCAGITAFHSVDSCNLKPGDWFGVVGCGGLGQLATQYAKAMGLKVVGVDIADGNLEEAKKQGADAVFNSRSNPNYVEELKKLTGGGCRAVAVYTNVNAAFASAPALIGLGGSLMVIGIPKEPLIIDAMDLVLGKYRILADSTSIPQRMKKAVDFTEKHQIMPVVDIRGGLDQLPAMVEEMQQGKNLGRTGVVF